MPYTKLDSMDTTDMDTSVDTFQVDPEITEGATGDKESHYVNAYWTQQLGYYKKIPELKSAIDARAFWAIGKGFQANPITELALMRFSGIGIDTFNTILMNQFRTAIFGRDSFAEIIRNKDDILINLKPLDPGIIRIVANSKGRIIRYEQISRLTTQAIRKFKPEEIFHLCHNRIADEIHGTSVIDAVEDIILALNEMQDDWRKVLHRNVVPTRIIEVDSDDTTELANLKTEYEHAINKGEVLIIPKGTVEIKNDSVPPNSTMNPLPTMQIYTSKFYQVVGTPKVIVGDSTDLTEAAAKVAYLTWQQTVEADQKYIEEQVLAQLNLEINLEFPADLMQGFLSDRKKDGSNQEGRL